MSGFVQGSQGLITRRTRRLNICSTSRVFLAEYMVEIEAGQNVMRFHCGGVVRMLCLLKLFLCALVEIGALLVV